MGHLIHLMRTALYLRYGFHRITGTGAFGTPRARFVSPPLPLSGNGVKDGLARHHVKQFHESSCSVASVACVVNTLLEIQGRPASPPVTQQDLLSRVTAAHWKERMGPNGYQGRRGLPLPVLGEVVTAALDTYGIRHQGISVVQATRDPGRVRSVTRTLWSRLAGFDRKGKGIVIAHFDQGTLVPDLNIPHISPVGGFDPDTGTVTILDVDASQPRHYTVSFQRFYRAISTHYLHLFRPFGYGRGGYIHIDLPPSQTTRTARPLAG